MSLKVNPNLKLGDNEITVASDRDLIWSKGNPAYVFAIVISTNYTVTTLSLCIYVNWQVDLQVYRYPFRDIDRIKFYLLYPFIYTGW